MSRAFIAFGGNLGDVKNAFISARNQIDALPQTHVVASSLLYRTPPVGPAGQPDYLNAVVSLETELAPLPLLEAMQAIETGHGRVRSEQWGARTLDLDIIAINGEIIDSEQLAVPHPLMFDRQFVLRPLCDLAPEWQHPELKQTAAERLQEIMAAGEPPLPGGEAW
ncbi:2-amino-4-hydroxy-6-hydroxymethyldihydropteridine diphosphokinase [Mariprofundus ferrinatatus]|uniref:2-amino-4-hydroxy-6-hydroxymethyldihydropteridine pyrophosphokinase n=1 Tax=Mariprofundus ferrinatatus TaxID=1921087 RepID=A0A2K8L2E6_9PROT|nr:2-amino-4-hydroxy-6-hydroxymethyldihydropteridine diphosphokinase [Mariprofundus ferrinatatus]ATX81488.1 2-amino-4-hydroxy-6-hydroxymethyldihydropteridine diphosphokinase [Mariprofundus ferrinatatus]